MLLMYLLNFHVNLECKCKIDTNWFYWFASTIYAYKSGDLIIAQISTAHTAWLVSFEKWPYHSKLNNDCVRFKKIGREPGQKPPKTALKTDKSVIF